MRIVYVHQDMPLMKMAIVCHVLATLGLLSTPKADACATAHADSFWIQWLDDAFAHPDMSSTSREYVSKFPIAGWTLTVIPPSTVKLAT